MKKMLKYRAVSALLSVLLLCTTVFTGITLSADAENESLPVYNAVSVIEAAKEKKQLDIDCVWSYSEKTVVKNKDTKEYLPTGPFVSKILDKCDGKCSNTPDIRAAFPEMLYKWETGLKTGEGFVVKNGKVVTYVGYNTNHAPALTFTAPKSGTVRLYDPNGGNIAGLRPDKTYWTMETAGEKIGIAIYKNNEKIWPATEDFTVISHENRSTAFPDIKDISVMQGDKLRIMLVPINNNYGYFELAPQIDYTSLTETLPIYDAVSFMTGAQANKKLDVTDLWSYSEKNVAVDKTGTYLPEGEFIPKVLDKCDGKCSNTPAIKTALANMLYKWEAGQKTGEGFAVKDGKIVTYVGHNTGHAPALTFTAPSTGKVRLFDKNGGNIATCTPKSIYWTLDGKDEKIGIAIYKNDEKIWPKNDDYSLLTNSSQSVEFPDISDIAVKKNDKLRIMLIPLNNNFGYVEFAPSVQYLSVEENMPEYKASDSVSAALANGFVPSDSKWIYTSQTVKLNSETGLYLPDSEWYHPNLEIAESDSADVNNALGKQLLVKGKNAGLAVKDGKVITYVGYAKGGGVAALTFVAPLSGTVNLSDPDEVKIGTAGTGKPFWTFHQPKRVGVAIYKNEEKIWPAAEPYRVLTGDKSENGKTVYGNKWLDVPELGDIRVECGDEIKIALIPIELHWGYFALNPCVSYKEVDAVQPEIKENPKYNSVDGVETALKNGGFGGTNWLFEGMPCYRRKSNNGQCSKYYVENSNPPIISKKVFKTAQALMKSRTIDNCRQTAYPLTKKLHCPECGLVFRRHETGGTPYWICSGRATGTTDCQNRRVREDMVYEAFNRMAFKLKSYRSELLGTLIHQMETMQERTNIGRERIRQIDKEIADLGARNIVIARLHTSGVLNAAEHSMQTAEINNKITELRTERRKRLSEDENDELIDTLKHLNEILEEYEPTAEFDSELSEQIIDNITVDSNAQLTFELIGGIRLTEQIDERGRCKLK